MWAYGDGMRLTIITSALAIAALTACSPLDPPVQFNQAPASVEDCTPSDEGGGTCLPPLDTTPPAPEGEGTPGCESGTLCTPDPNPPTPNICRTGEVEGGLVC